MWTVFASPAIALERLNQFYDEEFEGDPSSPKRIAEGSIDEASVRKERIRARQWAMPIIKAHFDPAGRSILHIRSRTGGLAKELAEAGAIVTAIDPMAASVRYMAASNQIEAIAVEPRELDSLAILGDRRFDAISLLTIHTLAHLSSPSRFSMTC